MALLFMFSPQGAIGLKWQLRAKIGPKEAMRTIKNRKPPEKHTHLIIHGNYNVLSGVSLVDTTEDDNKEDNIGSEHRCVIR
jgi:hypothetical protein